LQRCVRLREDTPADFEATAPSGLVLERGVEGASEHVLDVLQGAVGRDIGLDPTREDLRGGRALAPSARGPEVVGAAPVLPDVAPGAAGLGNA
jgi:hypothetical protein